MIQDIQIPDAQTLADGIMRFRDGAIGRTGLRVINGRVYEEAKKELVFPRSIRTFRTMMYDISVASANDLFQMLIKRVDITAEPSDPNNPKAVKNAEFINWMFNNLEGQSFQDIKNEILTYTWAGFSLLEQIFETVKDGDWEGWYRVKSLEPRAQESIFKWLYDVKTGRKLIGVKQSIIYRRRNIDISAVNSTVNIPIEKLLLFSYNATKNNPEGKSPLLKAYITWKFKCLFEDIEGTGISKDVSGIPVIKVPKKVVVAAQQDPESEEAALFNYMLNMASSIQNGSQLSAVIPVEYDTSGKELYNFELAGISGNGKSYDVDSVIRRRQTEILMAYFADIIALGNTSHGSFSLADSKTNLVAQAAEEHLKFITEVLQKQLVNRLAIWNEWDKSTIPVLKYGDIEKEDLDVFSKAVQRIFAVGAVEGRRDEYNLVREVLGLDDIDGNPYEIVQPPPSTSKSGQGMQSGMNNGTGQATKGGDTSSGNKENT